MLRELSIDNKVSTSHLLRVCISESKTLSESSLPPSHVLCGH